MKLQFSKSKDGEVILSVDGSPFDTTMYLKMVKLIKNGEAIEVDEFEKNISQDERDSITSMVKEINEIELVHEDDDEGTDSGGES